MNCIRVPKATLHWSGLRSPDRVDYTGMAEATAHSAQVMEKIKDEDKQKGKDRTLGTA